MKHFFILLKQSFSSWKKDNATVWCAAIAYYTLFSLGPLLLLIISVIGLLFTKTSIEKDVYSQLQGLLGNNGANMLHTLIQRTEKPSASFTGTIIGTIILIVGAAGVFGQLQQMLNKIWNVKQKPKTGIMPLVFNRILSFSMIGVIAFLFLVSLIASTTIASIATYFDRLLPFSPILLGSIDVIFSFCIITLLFAFIIKVLPDVQIPWRNVWIGSLLTSLLFTIGKELIGLYIGHNDVVSEYGAAGSLIVLLLWVYYSSQILFFGTEFTKQYMLAKGGKIIPSKYAVLNTPITKTDHQKKRDKTDQFFKEIVDGFIQGIVYEIMREIKNRQKKILPFRI